MINHYVVSGSVVTSSEVIAIMLFVVVLVIAVLHPGRVVVSPVRLVIYYSVLLKRRSVVLMPWPWGISMVVAIYKT